MSRLKIGWAEEIFEFTKPISLVGQFAERISEYTEKPLTATSMAVESADGEHMVICSTDLAGVSSKLVDTVKDKIRGKEDGLSPDKIIICAIHTHTGPSYTGKGYNSIRGAGCETFRKLLEAELPSDKKYVESVDAAAKNNIHSEDELLEELSSKIAKSILAAWYNRDDGSFINAFGRASVGMCRRVSYSDGSAEMWGDTNKAVFESLEGGNDSGIELMYVYDDGNRLKGIVANLACPAQCVQHRLFISPDFWGEVKLLLRKHFGDDLFLLPLCSAAGDQCPVDLVRWVEPESDVNDPNLKRSNPPKRNADPSMFDLAGMYRVGKRIANEIIDVYNEGLGDRVNDAAFVHQVHHMKLPLRRATLREEAEARKAVKEYINEKDGDVDYNDVAKLQVYLGILYRASIQNDMDIVDTEVHIIRLGDIAIATNPFELFLDYGNQIKARSLAQQTFIIQLANGTENYLPTKKAENGGHYSAFISSGTVGHEGGELLVRQTLDAVNGMWNTEDSI